MASNPYVNKVVYGTTTLIDLTQDTVVAAALMQGYTAHGADGALVVGALADGDVLGYGLGTSSYVNVAKADSAVIGDNSSNQTGRALAGYAVLSA